MKMSGQIGVEGGTIDLTIKHALNFDCLSSAISIYQSIPKGKKIIVRAFLFFLFFFLSFLFFPCRFFCFPISLGYAGNANPPVTFKTSGSGTVSAFDMTHTAIASNTSPTITINGGVFSKLQVLLPGEAAAPGTASGKSGTTANGSDWAGPPLTARSIR